MVVRWIIIAGYLALAALPLGWMAITSLKHYDDTISRNAKFVPAPSGTKTSDSSVLFSATTDGYVKLAQSRRGSGLSFFHYLTNSIIIAVASTIVSVVLGTSCAYGFSRFSIAGAKDWLFFVLSTRFMPPLAVVVPIFLMYRELNLQNS